MSSHARALETYGAHQMSMTRYKSRPSRLLLCGRGGLWWSSVGESKPTTVRSISSATEAGNLKIPEHSSNSKLPGWLMFNGGLSRRINLPDPPFASNRAFSCQESISAAAEHTFAIAANGAPAMSAGQ